MVEASQRGQTISLPHIPALVYRFTDLYLESLGTIVFGLDFIDLTDDSEGSKLVSFDTFITILLDYLKLLPLMQIGQRICVVGQSQTGQHHHFFHQYSKMYD